MKEYVLKKLETGKPISASRLFPADKPKLLAVLEGAGMSLTTAYLRLFTKGFDRWELYGIPALKREFLEDAAIQSMLLRAGVDGDNSDNGYAYVLLLRDKDAIIDEPGKFYEFISRVRGLRYRFCRFMQDRGMGLNTTNKRFACESWREWEQKGVIELLRPLVSND